MSILFFRCLRKKKKHDEQAVQASNMAVAIAPAKKFSLFLHLCFPVPDKLVRYMLSSVFQLSE